MARSDIVIDVAATRDHARLLRIWEAAVRATHHFLSEDDILFFRPLVTSGLREVTLTVATDRDQEILGFLGSAHRKIEMLFVDPQHHRSGIGRRLMEHAVGALGCSEVDVNEQNPAAADFYRSFGFTVADRSELDSTGRPFPILHMRRL